ncbi:hypothetical protein [Mesorhizobium onobrychidis]|uniref:Uncharacterized protein n=1 Tax=Mesorhizobium onobrychidis TaxID=2775404 RepID=A0ABY5R3S6_9HYPH|nr:hypothetical protein [Mesorhizobium onobrychidis]UVC17282.1 hypothetical protein IHQ72_09255 [Mesorhizobium onobrychidis]
MKNIVEKRWVRSSRISLRASILALLLLIIASDFYHPRADYQTLHDLKIDWPDFATDADLQQRRSTLFDGGPAELLLAPVLKEIDKSQVPVLVPADLFSRYANSLQDGEEVGSLGAQFEYIPTDSGFAAVFKGKEFDFVCRGYSKTLLTEGYTVEALGKETEPKIHGNSLGGHIATFMRYGASYACETICREAMWDAQESCVDESTLLSLVKSLVAIGPVR